MECHKTEKCYNYYCGQDKNCVNMQIQHKNGRKRLPQTMKMLQGCQRLTGMFIKYIYMHTGTHGAYTSFLE